jgi:hypothetical protein
MGKMKWLSGLTEDVEGIEARRLAAMDEADALRRGIIWLDAAGLTASPGTAALREREGELRQCVAWADAIARYDSDPRPDDHPGLPPEAWYTLEVAQ